MALTYPFTNISPIPSNDPYATPSLWNVRYTQIDQNFEAVRLELNGHTHSQYAPLTSPSFAGNATVPTYYPASYNNGGVPVVQNGGRIVNENYINRAIGTHNSSLTAHQDATVGNPTATMTSLPAGTRGMITADWMSRIASALGGTESNTDVNFVRRASVSNTGSNSPLMLATTAWIRAAFTGLLNNAFQAIGVSYSNINIGGTWGTNATGFKFKLPGWLLGARGPNQNYIVFCSMNIPVVTGNVGHAINFNGHMTEPFICWGNVSSTDTPTSFGYFACDISGTSVFFQNTNSSRNYRCRIHCIGFSAS